MKESKHSRMRLKYPAVISSSAPVGTTTTTSTGSSSSKPATGLTQRAHSHSPNKRKHERGEKMLERIEAEYEGRRRVVEAMELGKLIASLPKIAGFSPDMSRLESAWLKIQALGKMVVAQVSDTFTTLVDEAREVGVELTFHRPATLLQIMAEQFSREEEGEKILPPLYKGVSYNPAGANWREWLVLLDFFAIMRQFAVRGPARIQTAVLDASLYWMVNLLGKEGLILTSPDSIVAASEMITQLREHVDRKSPDPAVYDIALQRNAYMRAVAEQFPASAAPPVFTVLDVWEDPGFVKFLGVALQNFCAYKNGRWKVTKAVSYQRYMTYSPWVTPLVAAEQTFMAARNGFQLFLAPVQEAAWNKAVDYMSRLTRTSRYAVLMYDRPKIGELAYSDFPFFSDSWAEMTLKLNRAPRLLPIVSGFVKPFLPEAEATELGDLAEGGYANAASQRIVSFTSRIDDRARELEFGYQPLPLDNLGWLMQFPPGTC